MLKFFGMLVALIIFVTGTIFFVNKDVDKRRMELTEAFNHKQSIVCRYNNNDIVIAKFKINQDGDIIDTDKNLVFAPLKCVPLKD